MSAGWWSRRLAPLAAGVAAVACLAPVPAALAEPVFVGADTNLTGQLNTEVGGADCAASSSTSSTSSPVPENGGPVALSNTVALSATHLATPVATASFNASAQASVTSVGAMPRSIDVSVSGQGQVTFSQTGSGCATGGGEKYELAVHFALPSPAYLDMTSTTSGRGLSSFYLEARSGPASQFSQDFNIGSGTSTVRLLLPAGDYAGELTAGASMRTAVTAAGGGTASMHAQFTPVGAQLTPPTGKGGRYATLPSSATCANGTLAPAVTTSRKRAAKVRTVAFRLGSAKKKLHTPKKGQSVSLPFPGSQPGTLTATVTLRAHHGRKPKVLTVSATYEACS